MTKKKKVTKQAKNAKKEQECPEFNVRIEAFVVALIAIAITVAIIFIPMSPFSVQGALSSFSMSNLSASVQPAEINQDSGLITEKECSSRCNCNNKPAVRHPLNRGSVRYR